MSIIYIIIIINVIIIMLLLLLLLLLLLSFKKCRQCNAGRECERSIIQMTPTLHLTHGIKEGKEKIVAGQQLEKIAPTRKLGFALKTH